MIAPRATMPASVKKARRGYKLTPCGEIPQDWECVPLGQLCREVSERAGGDLPALSVTKYNGFVSSLDYFDRQVFSRDTSNYKVVRRGQFAYATIHLDEGSLGLLREYEAGLISPMYTVFALHARGSSEYLYSLLKSATYLRRYQGLGQGTVDRRKAIPFPTLAQMHVHWPPMRAQERIMKVLSNFELAIQWSIRLVEAKRNILSSVARRLFGEKLHRITPVPLCHVANVATGGTPKRSNAEYFSGDTPWVKTTEVQFCEIRDTEEHVSAAGVQAARLTVYPPGTVLVAMYGQGKTRGQSAILGVHAATNQACAAIMPGDQIRPWFLYYYLANCYEQLRAGGQGSNQDNLNQSMISRFPIRVPSKAIQQQIIDHLDQWTAAIAAEERKLAALERVKTELARRLLTGELRVKP